jgi:hypothetical protein
VVSSVAQPFARPFILEAMYTMNRIVAVGLIAVASSAGAQQQTLPAVRPLGPVIATSEEPMSSVAQVRALPGGRVLVHDLTGRRVLMFDSTFKKFTVVADSTDATATAYGSRLGGLIAYRADSTLFVDPASLSMLVIDPNGKIGRTMAAPRPNDINNLIGGPFGTPGFDSKGRLVYRAQIRPLNFGGPPAPGGDFQMPTLPESALVVRVDLATRKLDTVATFGIPKVMMNMTRNDNGGIMVTSTVNPMPWTDDWALLSDGTVAIVRGRDYRVDMVNADGKVTSAPKLGFDWQRMTDEDKMKVIDSTKAALVIQRANMIAQMTGKTTADAARNGGNAAGGDKAGADASGVGGVKRQIATPDGGGSMSITMSGPGGAGGRGNASFSMPEPTFVALNEMPDYRPVFRQGAARGDMDGNLWIRTSKVVNGGTVYDIINGQGVLTDRVQLPPGRVIAGFGPGGVVYMGVVDGTITHLERARVK